MPLFHERGIIMNHIESRHKMTLAKYDEVEEAPAITYKSEWSCSEKMSGGSLGSLNGTLQNV